MSPVLFAQEMATLADFKFNRLARVWFDDSMIFQQIEYRELTGYDALIIAAIYENDIWISLWVDRGVDGLPIAMGYQSDREIIITPVYKSATFERKLTDAEINELFTALFDDPLLLGED